ncbi:MAG TPA: molybdopterin-dependent oxidoreductase [Rubrivivax sp.]|nr:molybdopterin-dependent oxidoreductase [Burkholderiales bacterium]HNU09788.1 molybdopterin-dependent oxidoreductase [Rubrivivax sp.]
MTSRRSLVQAAASIGLLGWFGWAYALPAPAGPVVLTISGQVRNPNVGRVAQFDMEMLQQLPQTSFTTATPWFSKPRQFTGPLLRDVLRAAGAHGSMLHARALNDYVVDIPLEDAQRYDVILARLMDREPMPVRNRGPLFVIYPFDSLPELRSPVYFNRSAWQLRSIEVA